MNITCESCRAEHELELPSWVLSSGRPFRFRCSACGHSQMVDPPTALALSPDVATPAALRQTRTAAPSAPSAPTRPPEPAPQPEPPPEDRNVYLRQDGKVYLVKDWATLQRWIMERRVGRDDEVSEGGVFWEAVGGRPELGSFFFAIEQLEAFEAHTGGSPRADGGPERRVHGATGLARLDDDTEGVPMGLPPLPTEEFEVSDPGGPAAGHLGDIPPSRLTPATVPRRDGPTDERAEPTGPPTVAPSAPSTEPSTLPAQILEETPPSPPDARLPLHTIPAPPPGPAPEDAPTDAPAPAHEEEPDAVATPPSPPDDEDADLDLAFEAFEQARPEPPPSLPPPPRPTSSIAMWLWILTAAILAFVVILLGWGYGGAPPVAAPVAPAAPAPVVTPPPLPPPAAPPSADTDTDATETLGDTDGVTDTDTDAGADVAAEPAPAVTPPPAPVERPAAPRGPSTSQLVTRGFSEIDQRNYAAAAQTLADATRRAPNDARAQFGLGYALVELGRTTEARDALCRARATGAADIRGEADLVLKRIGATCP